MRQFLTSLQQIAKSDSVQTLEGVCRHLQWQMRKVLRDFPCELSLSESKLHVEKPTGVAALVNAMGEYDYNNMRLVKAFLQRLGGTFVDVGANIGAYTLIASEIEHATVVAVEAHPRTFASLIENVRLNQRHNVLCVNVAASSQDAEVQITDEAEETLNRIVSWSQRGERTLRVASRRLETVCRNIGVTPDFIKIDVEGHQSAVLQGLGQFRSTAKAIFVEGGEESAVREWMNDGGYIGPFFVHFNHGLIARERQGRPEDPVFVQRGFLREIAGSDFEDGLIDLSGFLSGRPQQEIGSAGIWR